MPLELLDPAAEAATGEDAEYLYTLNCGPQHPRTPPCGSS